MNEKELLETAAVWRKAALDRAAVFSTN